MVRMILGPLVGGVHPYGARLWARADAQTMLYAWVGQQPDLRDARYVGAALLTAETGFAGVVEVQGLQPNTRYHYALLLEEGPPDPAAGPYPTFVTAPEPEQPVPFAFAFGSCFLPRVPEDERIFMALNRAREQEDVRFALLLGDQVYADDWRYNGLGRVAQTVDDYRAVYAHVWGRPAWRQAFANLPVFMIWDDHEVDDDWHWRDTARTEAEIPWRDRLLRRLHGLPPEARRLEHRRVRHALQAYWEHQVLHAPPLLRPPEGAEHQRPLILPGDSGHLSYTFEYGAAAFFVLDVRLHRVRGPEGRRLLHPVQWQALETWLEQTEGRYAVRFLVSSVSVLGDLWIDWARDRWNGFPDERRRLLHLLAQHRAGPVILLTGDLHLGFVIEAELVDADGQPVRVWELSASPWAQSTVGWLRHFFRGVSDSPVRATRALHFLSQPHFGVVEVAYVPHLTVRFTARGRQGERLTEHLLAFPE